MRIYSKLALASLTFLLTLSLAIPFAFAQNAPSEAPPPPPVAANGQSQQNAMPGRMNGPMNRSMNGSMPGPMARRQWARHNRFQRTRWRGMHRRNRQFMLARLVRNPSFRQRLGISDEQAQKIRTQTFDFRKAEIRNRADVDVKRLELRSLLSAQNPDRSAIDKTLQELSDVRLTQEKAAVDFHLTMRAALTPDQWQKVRQMRQEFRHRRFGSQGFGPSRHAPADAPSTNG
jgi:Spy/CpxP family protein refolding chaperone